MKKKLALILTIALVISLLPMDMFRMTAKAATSGVFTYRVANGEAEITDCNTSATGELIIPETLDGYPVTSIDYGAFEGCSSLTSIEIPKSVTSIGPYAFLYCNSLTSIIVKEGNPIYYSGGNSIIETASNTLIVGCQNSIIPSGVTSIGDSAFRCCYSLTSIEIPESVTRIGNCAFDGCNRLTSIELPSGVTSIGDYAFLGCSSLTSIELSEHLTNVGESAFENCSSLTSIELPEKLWHIGDYAFEDCSSLTSIDIPERVGYISEGAFLGCSSLTSIDIPEDVTIGYSAFEDCDNLTDVWYSGTEEQAKALTIYGYNGRLKSATWHYDTCEEHVYTNSCDEVCNNCEWTRRARHNAVAITCVKATCTQEGNNAYWSCNNCGKFFRDEACTEEILLEDTVIPATGHKEKILPEKAATTTSTGLSEGKECSVCGKVLKAQKTIAKIAAPKASKLTKVTGGKKKITVKFKKISGIDGYEIQVALKKNFKSGKKTYNVKASAKSYVAKKLKGGKKYFVRIRTYKKVNGENVYSKWSTVKKVKTKK